MIDKLDVNDFRPIIIINKINELIDRLNEWEALSDEASSSVVKDAESSNVNATND